MTIKSELLRVMKQMDAEKIRFESARKNNGNLHVPKPLPAGTKERRTPEGRAEPLTEREFVRFFGTKVAHVRYSGRTDFVGLLVMGRNIGFTIATEIVKEKERRILVLIDKTADGRLYVTNRKIPLRYADSASFLKIGLLNYVA